MPMAMRVTIRVLIAAVPALMPVLMKALVMVIATMAVILRFGRGRGADDRADGERAGTEQGK